MATEKEILLIDIEVSQNKALADLEKQKEVQRLLKEETKDLLLQQKELIKNNDTQGEAYSKNSQAIIQNEAKLKNLGTQMSANQKIVQSAVNDTEGETGAYQRLNQQYSVSAQRAKDLSAAYGVNSTQARAAGAEAKAMSDKLKSIDTAVGQNQRSVGDYGIASAKLPGIFGQMQTSAETAWNSISSGLAGIKALITDYSAALTTQKMAQADATLTAQALAVAEKELAVSEAAGTTTAEQLVAVETLRATATTSATVATDASSASLKLFKIALASTGIGLIVVLLGSLISYFKQTHEGEETLEKMTNVLGATFKTLTGFLAKGVQGVRDFFSGIKDFPDLLSKVGTAIKENLINRLDSFSVIGKGIVKILSGDIPGGFKDLANGAAQGLTGVTNALDKAKSGFDKFRKAVKDSGSESGRITEMQQALDKFQSKAIETIATLEKKKDEFTLLMGKAGQAATTKEREQAMDGLIKTEDALMAIKVSIAKKTTAIKKAQLDLEQKQSGDAMLETMTAYRQAKADEIKLDGEYALLRKNVDVKRSKLYLQILQEEVNSEQTTYDQEKAITMQKFNDAKTSLDDRLSLLETMKQAEEDNFKSQTDSFDSYAKKKIDYNKLMQISDGAALSAEMQNIGLSKLAQAELLKLLNYRKTELLSLNQEDVKLKGEQANRLITDLQNELKLEDLKNKQLNAGKVLSHEQELKQMADAYKNESNQLKTQYDGGLIEEKVFNDKKALLDQQYKTDKSVSDAAFYETEKQNKANQLSDELEIVKGNFEAEAEIKKQQLEGQMAEELRAKGLTEAQKADIQNKYVKLAQEVDRTALNARLDQAKRLVDGIANLFGKQTTVAKMAASASIAIDTYKGASAAISSMAGAGPVGWAMGAIETGVIIASGLSNIKKVWATKSGLPGDGGGGGTPISSSVPISSVPASVSQQQAMQAGATSASTNVATSNTAQNITSQVAAGVSKALRDNPIQPVLVTNDLTVAQNNKVTLQNNNSL